MNIKGKLLFFCLLSLLAIVPQASADTDTIAQLTKAIAKEKAEEEKSRLHMYRARNYKNMGNMEMAEEDYDAALAYDHKGWIHLERSRFFIAISDYKQAKKEAVAAQKETPTLQAESQKLITIAEKRIKKEHKESKPQQILLTKRWEARYNSVPPKGASTRSNVRTAYAERNKKRAVSKPPTRRVARS